MSDQNIAMMKKILEEKRKKGMQNDTLLRPDKSIGKSKKGFKNKKHGGAFDK